MATLNRYRVLWSGGPGGAGVSTFYSLDSASGALAAIRAFFDACKGSYPNLMNWQFPNTGDQIASETGVLVGGWTQASAANVVGTGGVTEFAAGVGARVIWQTNSIQDGRRLKGATFLTSFAVGAYQNDGSIGTSTLTALNTAAAALVASDTICIWHRPTPGGADGGYGTVESHFIPDRITALRSRRY